jgi:hypothetical protein
VIFLPRRFHLLAPHPIPFSRASRRPHPSVGQRSRSAPKKAYLEASPLRTSTSYEQCEGDASSDLIGVCQCDLV